MDTGNQAAELGGAVTTPASPSKAVHLVHLIEQDGSISVECETYEPITKDNSSHDVDDVTCTMCLTEYFGIDDE